MSGGETPTGRAGRGGTAGREAAMGAMGGKPAEGAEFVCVKHRNLAEQQFHRVNAEGLHRFVQEPWISTVLVFRFLPKPVCGGMASGGCFILGGSEGGRG